MLQIDSATLKSIATESPASQTIFTALQARQRTRKITDLRQFQYKLLDEGAKLTKEDVMHTFTRLQDAGVGSLIIGRHGKPTRFKWNYSIKRIAQAANEKKKKESKSKIASVTQHPSSKRFSADELKERISGLIPSNLANKNIRAVMSTSIKLREGFSAKLEIPLDLTKDDADKLSEIIYSLVQTPSDEEKKDKPAADPKAFSSADEKESGDREQKPSISGNA